MDSSIPETPASPAPTPAPSVPVSAVAVTPAPAATPAVPPTPVSSTAYNASPDAAYLDAAQAANLRRAQSGANWLYWIAGMSLVNTAMVYSKANMSFAIGLFFTQIIDYGVHERSAVATYVGLGLDALILGGFVVLGLIASRRKVWPFIVGITLMVLDTVLLVWLAGFGAPLTIGIHIWAIVMMWAGMNALRAFRAQAAVLAGPAPSSPPPF